MALPLTVVILTKNEAKAIKSCILSLTDVDQIIVVDSNSDDHTAELAQNFGATVVNFSWDGSYPKKKQWSLELQLIRNDWVLFLDADESVSPEFFVELNSFLTSGHLLRYGAFDLLLDYDFMGKILKFGHKVRKRSLLNRKHCFFPEVNDLHIKNMWEVEGHYQPHCTKPVGKMKSRITHLDPDPLFDYFSRHNRYSDWEAELRTNRTMRESVRASKTLQGAIFDRMPFKPLFFFIYSYFFRLGLFDGRAGLNYSLALSFYYWQIYVKTIEKGADEKSS